MRAKKIFVSTLIFIVLVILAAVFLAPIFIVIINSFKSKFYVLRSPFTLPTAETFVNFENYVNGVRLSNFFMAFGSSVFITVLSVLVIVLLTAMTAWYLIRSGSRLSRVLYYLFVFSMIVPFQIVMFTMTYVASSLHFNNPLGIIVIYLGFGAGLSVFLFCGFVKGVPFEIEQAAMIDGCSPPQTFFRVVFPVLRPTAITVAILNTMWIWNDYLLPYLIIGTGKYKTIPIAVQQALKGGYGTVDWGAFMAMLILAIIPIVIFYLLCQKHIIKGVVAGAVKG